MIATAMSITIKTNPLFTLKLGNHRLDKILSAQSRQEAVEMGPWDAFKDWCYDGQKARHLHVLYDASRHPGRYQGNRFRASMPREPLFNLYHSHEEFLSELDDQGKSLADRLLESNDPIALKNYLNLLYAFVNVNQLTDRDDYREFVMKSTLQLTLSIVFNDIAPASDVKNVLYDMHLLFSGWDSEMTQRFVSDLLNDPAVISSFGNKSGELVMERIGHLFCDSKNLQIGASVKEFLLNHSLGQTLWLDALASGDVDTMHAIEWLMLTMSVPDWIDVVRTLIAQTDRQGIPVIMSSLSKGHEAAVKAALLIIPLPDRFHTVESILLDQTCDKFSRAIWAGDLKDLGFCMDLLGRLAAPDASNLCKRLMRAHERGVHQALTGAGPQSLVADQPLIIAMIEMIRTYCDPQDLRLALAQIPKVLLEAAIEKILTISPDKLAPVLDHLSNDPPWSLLVLIENLPAEDKALKKRLTAIVAEKLKNLPGRSIHRYLESIRDRWLGDPMYLEVPEVLEFFRDTDTVITSANSQPLKIGWGALLPWLELVTAIVALEADRDLPAGEKFMIKNNCFFVQLIRQCTNHLDLATKKMAEELYDSYLDLPELRAHKELLKDVFMVDDGIRHMLVDDTGKKLPIDITDPVYLFVRPSIGKIFFDGILLSAEAIDRMLACDPDFTWPDRGFLTEQTVTVNNVSTTQLVAAGTNDADLVIELSKLPLFAYSVMMKLQNKTWAGLLDLLDLNPKPEPQVGITVRYNYRDAFNRALCFDTSSTKFVDDEHQKRLGLIFSHHLHFPAASHGQRSEPTLTDQHTAAIQPIFRLAADTPAQKLESARKLFCLATIFVRLSSDVHFGTSSQSPLAIRDYAAALLKHAHLLDPSVCGSQYENIMSRLLGRKSVSTEMAPYTCTATLHGILAGHVVGHADFAAIYRQLKPQGWR